MFILVSQKGSKAYYFLEDKQCTIGRKETDILINNDNSISKKHAIIKQENGNMYLMDIGSKYKTFINDEEIAVNQLVQLKEGDELKFGILESVFRLEYKNFYVLCSSLSDTDKIKLGKLIEKLNGTILKKWNKNCTHTVAGEIVLTSKILSSIIEGTPIVTLKFLEDMLACIQNNIPPPIEADYTPPSSEMFLSAKLTFEYRPERKHLFKNKVFVFETSKVKRNLEDVIVQGGGKCILYTDIPISDQKLTSNSPQYLFVGNDENSQKSASAFDNITERLKKVNRRLIPHQEIAMALLACSCEKNCNPDFDRVGTLIALGDGNKLNNGIMLAMETQSQNCTQLDAVKTEGFVPDTYEPDIFAPVVQAPLSSTQLDMVDLSESTHGRDTASVKRLAEDLINEDAKRKKITTENRECVSSLSPISKVGQGKTFKDKGKETQTSKSPKPSNECCTPSLVFGQRDENAPNLSKRKSDDQISDRPTKRRNERVNPFAVPSKPSANSTIEKFSNESNIKRNPFARLADATQASNSKSTSMHLSNDHHNSRAYLEHNHVNVKQESTVFTVTAIDPATERSFGWLTKNYISDGHVDVKPDPSDPLTALFDSFRGCVIVEIKPLVVSRGRCDVGEDTIDTSGRCVKNFKKFKKIKPLRIQTKVIPQSMYTKVICNQSQLISSDLCSDEEDDENVPNPFSRVKTSQVKPARKIYGI